MSPKLAKHTWLFQLWKVSDSYRVLRMRPKIVEHTWPFQSLYIVSDSFRVLLMRISLKLFGHMAYIHVPDFSRELFVFLLTIVYKVWNFYLVLQFTHMDPISWKPVTKRYWTDCSGELEKFLFHKNRRTFLRANTTVSGRWFILKIESRTHSYKETQVQKTVQLNNFYSFKSLVRAFL